MLPEGYSMSEMLDSIIPTNFIDLTLSDDLLPIPSPLKAPGQSRLNRSASFFTPPSHSALSSLSLSSEHLNSDDNGSSIWSSNIWSQAPGSNQKPAPFRSDRSMSMTEPSSSLLPPFGQLKSLDPFTQSPASTVAPPPGFPPSSNLPAQVPPMLSSNRYKTELCRGFQETGNCKYGNKCQFAHGEAELRGLYRHPKYKTEPCRTFYNFGYCPYGSRCHFIHGEKNSDGPLGSIKFQRQPLSTSTSNHNPRHQLRQSLSFAGFVAPSRSSSPPSFSAVFNDPNLGFSRAPSVSPPPTELLPPVFSDSAFLFETLQNHANSGDIPLILEPKPSRCVCGHGNNFNKSSVFTSMVDEQHPLPVIGSHGAFRKSAGLHRFSSEDSLEDGSSSSSCSSGTESPTFDGSTTKRLTVFERLSLSD
ncbi:mRNA decay activator protein ZFP36 [Nothobranchius furzeri]|uniref:mRNA decay activator protein ZFP36 n=1 Tax=Nothobranchius furzeri TaxID=105023 RepID=A0A1A8B4L0_NOTFU|nr:mRNA decay activator protein ZFP36 [Nothobranchius furzeri]KAF7219042.1 tristetraprolin-like [Nothobranchius furzeri]